MEPVRIQFRSLLGISPIVEEEEKKALEQTGDDATSGW